MEYERLENSLTPESPQLKVGNPQDLGLGVLWTLAIEEQFYLIFPLLLIYTPKNKLPIILVSLFLISSLSMKFWGIDYSNTIGSISDLAIGAFGAFLLFYYPRTFKTLLDRKYKHSLIMICVLGGLTSYLFCVKQIGFRFIISLMMAFLVVIQSNNSKKNFYFLDNPITIYLGKISYGLYLFHSIAIAIVYLTFKHFNPDYAIEVRDDYISC